MSNLTVPAFSRSGSFHDDTDSDCDSTSQNGLNKREYAAIHLCVPMSGDAELDAMIRRAQRVRLAGMALSGMSKHDDNVYTQARAITLAISADQYADALPAELEKP